MNRLPGELPDRTRMVWVSDEARSAWRNRVNAAAKAVLEVERWSVVDEVRPAAVQIIETKELPRLSRWALEHGLVVVVLNDQGNGRVRVAVSKANEAAKLADAFDASDNETIGEMLGYPVCCRAAFQNTFVVERWSDTTYRAASGGADGPAAANMLLRWAGVRLVPHLPCSFNCSATVKLAEKLRAVAVSRGYTAEWDDIATMLTWPVQWTAFHGIAEVTTPVFRILAQTDLTADKLVVRREGSAYPEEGATGVVFPFRRPEAKPITLSKAFAAGAAHANGFSDVTAMRLAHSTVLKALQPLLKSDETPSVVGDFGCGDGTLVQAIATMFNATPWGVEVDGSRAQLAMARLGEEHVVSGNMFTTMPPEELDLAVVMPGRLLETKDHHAFVERLRRCRWVLCYVYGDWAKRGGLKGLVSEVGLDVEWEVGSIVAEAGSEAVLLTRRAEQMDAAA